VLVLQVGVPLAKTSSAITQARGQPQPWTPVSARTSSTTPSASTTRAASTSAKVGTP